MPFLVQIVGRFGVPKADGRRRFALLLVEVPILKNTLV